MSALDLLILTRRRSYFERVYPAGPNMIHALFGKAVTSAQLGGQQAPVSGQAKELGEVATTPATETIKPTG